MIEQFKNIKPANPFRPEGILTLADVLAEVERTLEGNTRRDTRSAFTCLARARGVDLATVAATPQAVRPLLASLTPGALDVSEKRLANLRSLVSRAVEQFGMKREPVTKARRTAAWEALITRVQPKPYRTGLSRLSAYCSAMGIAPEQVSTAILRDFHDALAEECIVKDPRKLLKHTIACWNHCGRNVPGWPQAVLASPYTRTPDTLPLDAFPESFRADVARWEARVRTPDRLDVSAPVEALRPSTIHGYIVILRRFASALVHRGILPTEAITGLDVLFEDDRFTEGLRHFIPAADSPEAAEPERFRYAHAISVKLVNVARHYLRLPEAKLASLAEISDRLNPHLPRIMGKRHRERLEQFDDPVAVHKLLTFPETELARARKATSPIRAVKAVERALAVSLSIHISVRIENLRTIHLVRSLRESRGRMFVRFQPGEVKNSVALEFELAAEPREILAIYLAEYRQLLPGHEGDYLFPGIDGGPRSDSAMREAIESGVAKHCGLTVNPQLYRHIIAKILVEHEPELCLAISRHLGHKTPLTTMASYLGTEGPAACRAFAKILEAYRLKTSRGEV